MTEHLSQSTTDHAFETILVPLDGSPLAERALPYAEVLAMARVGGPGHIVLVQVLDEDDTEAEASAYLVAIAERLRERGLDSEIAIAQGKPGDEIVREIGRRGADIVVMATHGRSGLGRWVYGSVAEFVLDRAAVPVLLARAWAEAPPTTQSVQRVLVPLDGSPFAEAALPTAAALASNRVDTQLHLQQIVQPAQSLFTSWTPGVVYSDLGMDTELDAARTYLEAIVERLERELGVPASQTVIHVLVGVTADSIVQTAREQRCDLIVMATHGHTGVARVVLGSVADAVLRGGSTPVLLVRPPLTDGQPPRPRQLDNVVEGEGR